MRKWNVRLDSKEIDKLIGELQAYRQSLDDKLERLKQRIADNIAKNAESGFAAATVNGEHSHQYPITVSVEQGPGGDRIVVAAGQEVCFIEFGAGVYWNGGAGSSPHPKGVELGMTIGSYGKGQGANESWKYYDGRWHTTHGTVAQMPMYWAFEDTLPLIQDIARSIMAYD